MAPTPPDGAGEEPRGGAAPVVDAAGPWRTGPRTRVRRLAERGRYDRLSVEAILDEGFVCHVGFATPEGPVVIPTGYGRVGDALYLHGAAANHALKTIGDGAPVCVTVTLVDGLVLARSAFHHSINYRSVVAYGRAFQVRDAQEQRAALEAVVEHIVPGRAADARAPDANELRATRVVRVDIDEASAKVREGGPNDDPEDLERPGIWAGQLPLVTVAGEPVVDTSGPVGVPVPPYVTGYRRPAGGSRAPESADR